MGNLANFSDPLELDNKYSEKVIVFVEGEGDVNFYEKLLGIGFAEKIEFKLCPDGRTGFIAVKERVADERKSNTRVFGLLDGEAGVTSTDGFERLLACKKLLYTSDDPILNSIMFLAEHELENILLSRADVCAFIASDATLVGLGSKAKKEAEIRERMAITVRHYFGSALCKYASARLHFQHKMDGILDSGPFWHELPLFQLKAAIRTKVEKLNGDWKTFVFEVRELATLIAKHFDPMGNAQRDAERLRLTDGKSALTKLRDVYKFQPSSEGHLLSEIAKTPYATSFRAEIFALTGA